MSPLNVSITFCPSPLQSLSRGPYYSIPQNLLNCSNLKSKLHKVKNSGSPRSASGLPRDDGLEEKHHNAEVLLFFFSSSKGEPAYSFPLPSGESLHILSLSLDGRGLGRGWFCFFRHPWMFLFKSIWMPD